MINFELTPQVLEDWAKELHDDDRRKYNWKTWWAEESDAVKANYYNFARRAYNLERYRSPGLSKEAEEAAWNEQLCRRWPHLALSGWGSKEK